MEHTGERANEEKSADMTLTAPSSTLASASAPAPVASAVPSTASVGPTAGDTTALSGKALKERKKLEKAAKRAAHKEAIGITPEQQRQMAQQKKEKSQAAAAATTTTNLKKQLNQTLIKDTAAQRKVPALFSHLETREQRNALLPLISHIVHPAILLLALKHSSYRVVGLIPRLRSMMEAFQVVVALYETPPNTTLTRHLTGHLLHQIDYLRTARPLLILMGNAIRWLKQEISVISIDTSDEEARQQLVGKIGDFIRDKIELSHQLIVEYALQHISDGLTILTFGHLQVLEALFAYCAREGKHFQLIIVDLRPLFEGKTLLQRLVRHHSRVLETHIKVQYTLILLLLSTILEDVDCVFLGAHAMLSNGRLYLRVGTGLIAMMAHRRNIPVLTCCELIKFSDKVQLDLVTTNELGDSDDLAQAADMKRAPHKRSFALEQFLEAAAASAAPAAAAKASAAKAPAAAAAAPAAAEPLALWRTTPSLNILNVMYDLTPPEYINKVVTELGALPPLLVPVILREYKNT